MESTPNTQKCNCGNSNCKPSNQMNSSDSDVFYDVPDDTNRSAILMSSILQNVVETTENLMTTFERAMRESMLKFRSALTGLNVPEENLAIAHPVPESQTKNKLHSDGFDFRRITVDPVVITVPITLYIQPKIEEAQVTQDPIPENCLECSTDIDQKDKSVSGNAESRTTIGNFLEHSLSDEEPIRTASISGEKIEEAQVTQGPMPENCLECSTDIYQRDKSVSGEAESRTTIVNFLEHSLSDEEPIRTASISVPDGRLSEAPIGFPKLLNFSDDITMSEKQDSMEEILPEPDIELMDSRKDLAERDGSLGSIVVLNQELPMPQQKDLRLCVNCSCGNCPVYDLNKQIVCPRNCNCCVCPWKEKNEDSLSYLQVRICQCYNKRNPESDATRAHCRCLPQFDICPCRDVAESRHIELYGTDMYEDLPEIKKND